MTQDNGITTSIQTITPERAAALLEGRASNRKISEGRVRMYARDMAAGRWMLNGQGVIIDSRGQLVDGQHRLTACVRSGVPLRTTVTDGVPPGAMHTLDATRPRNVSDALNIRGAQYSRGRAAAVRALHTYSHFSSGTVMHKSSIRPSTAEMLRLHDLHEPLGLFHAVAGVYSGANSKVDVIGMYAQRAAVGYGIMRGHGLDLMNEWNEGLISGVGLSYGDPRLLLRNRLSKAGRMRGEKLDPNIALALIIKAANAFVDGRDIGGLKLMATEKAPILDGFHPDEVWGPGGRPSDSDK